MYKHIEEASSKLQDKLTNYRRDFHKYAEAGWLEIRTASLIARRLTELGYEVLVGEEVCLTESRMGVPSQTVLDENYDRAIAQGADKEFAEKVRDAYTGVIGIIKNGEGPVVALRFDIDALGVIESEEEDHIPFKEKFNSVNFETMHACGHDGHATIGLGVAEVLMGIKDSLKGTVKLIFQPAEEGVMGAKSIVDKGHLNDVDFLISGHISGNKSSNADLHVGTEGALATTKFDVTFKGVSSHAGGNPQGGKNAMLSVATAILNLHSIPRHSEGITRVNVGKVVAGTGKNVITDIAEMEVEIRGETSEINKYMEEYAFNIIESAAKMHGATAEINIVGGAGQLNSTPVIMDRVKMMCEKNYPDLVLDPQIAILGGSEDFSFMSEKVINSGKESTYMIILTNTYAPGHNRKYNFDETVLPKAVKIFSATVYDLLGSK